MRKLIYVLITVLVIAVVPSCKKDSKKNSGNNTDGPSKTGTTMDLIKDSIYLYTKEDYLWHDAIPDYAAFNPRSFSGSDDLSALQKEVDALSQYKTNTTTGRPFEYYEPSPGEAKYSFVDDGSESSRLNAVTGDFGFGLVYISVDDLRIKYVYPNSPADQQGIKRGYKITRINDHSGSSLTYDNGSNTNYVINAYSNSSTISMTLKRPDNTTFEANLNATTYTVQPVLTHKVITSGTHKIGYIVFNSFTSPSTAQPGINAAFADFGAITDLVVDLRYNGGGYVSTAEYLDNLIVPSSKSGTLMYNTYYTDNLVNHKAPLLKNQVRSDGGGLYNLADQDYSVAANVTKFAKQGSLNISRVFFIVTGSTASASELTINNLRPVMDVKLIGSTTYGKPVGFFDIDINKYQLYIPEFSTKNSAGQGDYYDGLTPGDAIQGVEDNDDVTKDFGDVTETLLAHAINYVKTGTFSLSQQVQSTSRLNTFSIQQTNQIGLKLNPHKFMGMIFDKSLKRKK
jgi:hypothetical protein